MEFRQWIDLPQRGFQKHNTQNRKPSVFIFWIIGKKHGEHHTCSNSKLLFSLMLCPLWGDSWSEEELHSLCARLKTVTLNFSLDRAHFTKLLSISGSQVNGGTWSVEKTSPAQSAGIVCQKWSGGFSAISTFFTTVTNFENATPIGQIPKIITIVPTLTVSTTVFIGRSMMWSIWLTFCSTGWASSVDLFFIIGSDCGSKKRLFWT